MANFSSFFPVAAAGGGGFTKMNKYVTLRSLGDATHFEGSDNETIRVHPTQSAGSSGNVGSNKVDFYRASPSDSPFNTISDLRNRLVGKTFTRRDTDGNSDGQVYTITSIDEQTGISSFPVSFTPSLTVSLTGNHYCDMDLSYEHTVNPATDLGLEDGASIGYFMCGGGRVGDDTSYTGFGGKIIQGTAIISSASTDLVLTPGIAEKVTVVSGSKTEVAATESTISGGLTLSTADGSRQAGFRTTSSGSPGSGINGYGVGGGGLGYNDGSQAHGWGGGTRQESSTGGYPAPSWSYEAGDGAILLYY